MPITVKNWVDSPSTTTPISAAALEDLETRLGAYTDTQVTAATYTDEQVRDVIGTALVAGAGITVTVSDAGNTITIVSNVIESAASLTTVTSTQAVPDPSSTGNTWVPYTVDKAVTFTFPTAVRGKSFTLELRQNATGNWPYTWPGTVKFPAGVAPTPSGANKIDLVSFASDGTSYFGSYAVNY